MKAPHSKVLRRRAPQRMVKRGLAWLEAMETRVVLSAPPVFGDIPAVVTDVEFSEDPFGRYYLFFATATDADSLPSQLVYSIDSGPERGSAWINPSDGGFHYDNALHAPDQVNVTIRVTDETGLFDTASFVINVVNQPPTVWPSSAAPGSTSLVGEACLTQSAAIYDSGDTIEGWWNFGDGTVTAPQVLPVTQYFHRIETHYTSAAHVYTRPGVFTIQFFGRDQHGVVVSTATSTVTVLQYGVDPSGTLRVGGTDAADNIHVSPAAGGKVNLFIGGALKGVFAANSVIAYGNGGDDVLDANEWLNVPVKFHGGQGSDLLRGGMANDALFGEEGNDRIEGRSGHDILIGSNGNDRLRGCGGRDLLLGGAGFDSLYGDADDDILVAGTTSHDSDLNALQKIRDEWVSTRPYGVRVDNIRTGTGSGDRANESYFFAAGTTVFDDATEDWLCGVGGQDWFFASTATGDKLMDRLGSEEVDA